MKAVGAAVCLKLAGHSCVRAVTFEYSRSAPHAAIVPLLKADFMANRTATKEAAGPETSEA